MALGPRIALSIAVAMFGAVGCASGPDTVHAAGNVGLRPTADALIRPSSDDCAIVVAIGTQMMGWRSKTPLYAFYQSDSEFLEARYLSDCPLESVGVARANIGTADTDATFSVSAPEYVGDRAAVFIVKRSADFGEGADCTVEKKDGQWRVIACEVSWIS